VVVLPSPRIELVIKRDLVIVGGLDGILRALDAGDGRIIWTLKTEGAIRSSPTVAYGEVYVGSEDGHVYSVAAETGMLNWRFRTEGKVWSSAAVSANNLFIGSGDGYLYSLEAATGVLKCFDPNIGSHW